MWFAISYSYGSGAICTYISFNSTTLVSYNMKIRLKSIFSFSLISILIVPSAVSDILISDIFATTTSDRTTNSTQRDILLDANRVQKSLQNISAGDDKIVDENSTVTLHGEASTSGGAIYSWEQTGGTPAVNLTSNNGTNSMFVAPNIDEDALLTFNFLIHENSDIINDTMSVVVRNLPESPVANYTGCTTICFPIANAGFDQTVNPNSTVSMSAALTKAGSAVLGPRLDYSWYQIAGPNVNISGANSANPSFTAPHVSEPSVLRFNLETKQFNNKSGSPSLFGSVADSDSIDIAIIPFNRTQTSIYANAGPDKNVIAGNTIVLNGTDSRGDSLSFSWKQKAGLPLVSLNGTTSSNSTFVAPRPQNATALSFDLVVTDVSGRNDSDIVNVFVNGTSPPLETVNGSANTPPIAESQSVVTNTSQPVNITLSGTDPDANDTLPIETVNGFANTPPIAESQSVVTNTSQPVNITLSGTDPDANDVLFGTIVLPPSNGVSGELDQSSGIITYTPYVNFTGGDEFTFKVNDTKVPSNNTGTVFIMINDTSLPPLDQLPNATDIQGNFTNLPPLDQLPNATDIQGNFTNLPPLDQLPNATDIQGNFTNLPPLDQLPNATDIQGNFTNLPPLDQLPNATDIQGNFTNLPPLNQLPNATDIQGNFTNLPPPPSEITECPAGQILDEFSGECIEEITDGDEDQLPPPPSEITECPAGQILDEFSGECIEEITDGDEDQLSPPPSEITECPAGQILDEFSGECIEEITDGDEDQLPPPPPEDQLPPPPSEITECPAGQILDEFSGECIEEITDGDEDQLPPPPPEDQLPPPPSEITECPAGQILDEFSGECIEEITDGDEDQLPPPPSEITECPAGQILDEFSGECIEEITDGDEDQLSPPPPEDQLPPPPSEITECPAGQILDEFSGECIEEITDGDEDQLPPPPSEITECPAGQILDEFSGECIEEITDGDEDQLSPPPPEDQLPPPPSEITECPAGQILDEFSGECIEEITDGDEDQLPPPPSEITECPAGQILDEFSGECIEEITGDVDQPSPETQEICDNGIDDDGDILIDAEDVENCPTTSSSSTIP